MKPLLAVLFLLTTLASCQRSGTLNQKFLILSQEEFLKDNYNSTVSTLAILDKYTLSVQAILRHDTGSLFYGPLHFYDDSLKRQIVIGKLIDNNKIIATEVNDKDTSITFYLLENSKWRQIGKEKVEFDELILSFDDLNGDNKNEIITSTLPNFNANRWMNVYIYSNKHKDIRYAGWFSTDYEILRAKGQIKVSHEGSWYTQNHKTLYAWRNEKLLPVKSLVRVLDEPDNIESTFTLEYYENRTDSANGMKLIYKKPIRNEEDWKVWENFYDTLTID